MVKPTFAFWPADVENVTAAPFTVAVRLTSAGTLNIFKVSLPKFAPLCCTHSWYCWFALTDWVSMKNVCPDGLLLIEMLAWVDVPVHKLRVADAFVTLVACIAILGCAAVGVKLKRTSCPATVVLAVTLPPTVIVGVITS